MTTFTGSNQYYVRQDQGEVVNRYHIPYQYNPDEIKNNEFQFLKYYDKQSYENEQSYMLDISKYFTGDKKTQNNGHNVITEGKINLQSINKNNEADYKQSSLEKFIFLSRLMQIPCIRVVCHSHTMQQFIKSNALLLYKEIKDAAKKQNAWTFFLKTGDTNFVITRHGYSIANYIKDKAAIEYHKFNLYQQHQHNFESDPALSLWGILTSIYRGSILKDEEDRALGYSEPNYIHVSILIRTWMTAMCLYLPYVMSDTFTLVITPYISESGFTSDNKADKIDIQKKKIYNFLNYLKDLKKKLYDSIEKKDDVIYENVTNSFLDVIKQQLKIIYRFITDPAKKIIIKHIFGNFSIICGETFLIQDMDLDEDIQIRYGVCKPNKPSLKQMKTECEHLSSKYNDQCNYQSSSQNHTTELFTNICVSGQNIQGGGNCGTKKKNRRGGAKKSRHNKKSHKRKS